MVFLKEEDYAFWVLKKYSDEVVRPHLGIDIQNSGYSDNNINLSLPSSFSSYEKTEYYYKGENKFIHFTSLETFFRIINSGYFLANQLSSLDDPRELIFAGNELLRVTTKERLNLLKKYLFSFSMCHYYENSDSFEMWSMYGENGYGVGIVFSFYDNIESWNDSFLSTVQYGNENSCLDKFMKFSDAHCSFMKNHPDFTMQSGIGGIIGASDTMALFLAFHKTHLYQQENEVRYLKSFIDDSHKCSPDNGSIGINLNKRNEVEYFYKIPIVCKKNIDELCNKKKEEEIKNFRSEFIRDKDIITSLINNEPFIMLEKVILGYRYTDEVLFKIKQEQSKIIEKLNGTLIDFELSKVSNEFYDNSR